MTLTIDVIRALFLDDGHRLNADKLPRRCGRGKLLSPIATVSISPGHVAASHGAAISAKAGQNSIYEVCSSFLLLYVACSTRRGSKHEQSIRELSAVVSTYGDIGSKLAVVHFCLRSVYRLVVYIGL